MTFLPRAAAAAATALSMTILAAVSAGSAAASYGPTPVAARAGGADRFATAAAVSKLMYPGGADTAILARGDVFPDALAAAGLSGKLHAPVLLTAPGALQRPTFFELARLKVKRVFLLGGDGAVSDSVAGFISNTYDVERLAGTDRYDTARLAALLQASVSPITEVAGKKAAILVNGDGFADAVSAGAPAALGDTMPILLSTLAPPLPLSTLQALTDLDVGFVYVIGGTGVINDDVLAELRSHGIEPRRIAGADRTTTAAEVARTFVASGAMTGDRIQLVRGDDFADALTAGPLAASQGGPVLLARSPTELGLGAANYLFNTASAFAQVGVVRAVGGQAALSADVLKDAVDLATRSPGSADYIASAQEVVTAKAGSAIGIDVRGYSLQPLVAPMTAALVPCRNGQVLGVDDQTFTTAAGEIVGEANGSTDTGSAAIAVVNGRDVANADKIRDIDVQDNTLRLRLYSGAPDCAIVLVYDDADGNDRLLVDSKGRPVERYAVFQLTWTN